MKTRNLWTSVICDYLNNRIGAIIILNLLKKYTISEISYFFKSIIIKGSITLLDNMKKIWKI